MNNQLDLIDSLTLPTFSSGREVTAAQLNTIVSVFKEALEVLRDRVDYIRNFDDGSDYPDAGNMVDNVGASYQVLELIRQIVDNLTTLTEEFEAYAEATDARIGNWASIYKPQLTNITDALNDLNTQSTNNRSVIAHLLALLDGVTVSVLEDLKEDIDYIQQHYPTTVAMNQAIGMLAGAGRTTETVKTNADDIVNLNIDVQDLVESFPLKADLINGTVPEDQLPITYRSAYKGRFLSVATLNSAWPSGSTNLIAGDFAVVAGTSTDLNDFYVWDAIQLRWEFSGTSGTVNTVNTVLPDTGGNVTITSDNVQEGTTNKYFTTSRVTNTAAVLANTSKRTYPLADQNKVAGIQAGATVGATWGTDLNNIPTDLVYDSDLSAYTTSALLAIVATSGSYLDLLNRPTIPSAVSQLTNDRNYVARDTVALTNYLQTGDVQALLANKVDVVSGKELSEANFTSAEKTKLGGIEGGAQVNNVNTTIAGNTFNGANQLVQLNSVGKLPALNGANLTNLNISLPLTAKGDILVHSGSGLVKLASGATSQILTVDPTTTSGLSWKDNAANSSPTTFLGLNDTPNTYIGNGGKVVIVNNDESQIEFLELNTAITGEFVNGDLVSSVLTVEHDLGNVIMSYTITDESGNVMIPNDVHFGDGEVVVTLTDFAPITGTWRYLFGATAVGSDSITDKIIKINNKYSNALGVITLLPSDIGALPSTTTIPTTTSMLTNNSGFITNSVNTLTNYPLSSSLSAVALTGSYSDLLNKPTIPTLLSQLTQTSSYRTVTDTEKNTWNGKQAKLVSGSNIKSINSISLLGDGNISIVAGVSSVNTKSGDVTLTPDDLSDTGTTNKFVTAAEKSTWNNKQNAITANVDYATPATVAATYEPKKAAGDLYLTSAERTKLANTSGENTGDETVTTIKTKLGITTLSGNNTGDETASTLKNKLAINNVVSTTSAMATPIHIQVGGTEPAAIAGVTILWIE